MTHFMFYMFIYLPAIAFGALHFLHIPKTAGTTVRFHVEKEWEDNNLNSTISYYDMLLEHDYSCSKPLTEIIIKQSVIAVDDIESREISRINKDDNDSDFSEDEYELYGIEIENTPTPIF